MHVFTSLLKFSQIFSHNFIKLATVKGALSGLRQFFAIESPLKMIKKNAFSFTSKPFFVLKISKFLL